VSAQPPKYDVSQITARPAPTIHNKSGDIKEHAVINQLISS